MTFSTVALLSVFVAVSAPLLAEAPHPRKAGKPAATAPKKTKALAPKKKANPPPPVPKRVEVVPMRDTGPSLPAHGNAARIKFNSGFGPHYLATAGIARGIYAQLGFEIFEGKRIYAGPRFDFSLFPTGSNLNALGSAWMDFALSGSGRSLLSLGGSAGVGVASAVQGLGAANSVFFGDVVIASAVNDLASLRLDLHPGLLGNQFAFFANIGVQFMFF